MFVSHFCAPISADVPRKYEVKEFHEVPQHHFIGVYAALGYLFTQNNINLK